MNPLTNVKNITKLNETELASGSIHKKSWHDMYKDSAWIFIGGLEYGLTEGDVLAVFSQYGEIVNINLVRDKKTGKSKGFCFLCYANQKSTVLAVDNFNGIKLCKRTIRVDHVANYKPPKEHDRDDETTKMLKAQGCAPHVVERNESNEISDGKIKKKKSKKEKKEKKKKKRKNKSDASDSEKETSTVKEVQVKKEKHDPGYDKYDTPSNRTHDIVKRKHQERNMEHSKGEISHSRENSGSKVGKHYFKTERDDVVHKDRFKVKTEQKSHRHEDSDKDDYMLASSSKRHKRKRSTSSSDDHTSNYRENGRHKENKDVPKTLSNRKRKYKDAKDSSSSGSDHDSSSQSSLEDEKQNRYSRKDKYKTHDEKRSFQEGSRDRNYDRTENSAYISSKSRHHDKAGKYSECKSKTKYRSDDSDDTHHRNSHYHKSKHNRK